MIGNGRQHKIVIDNSIPEFSQFKDNLDMAIADWQAVEFWNSQLPKIGDDGS